MTSESTPPPIPPPPSPRGVPEPVVPIVVAEQLFQGTREVCIEFGGIRYRLRITRRNKLILQK